MDKTSGNLLFVNICCFGVSHMGVAVSAVVAQMCPFLNVTVVDLNPNRVTLWNTKQISIREPGLEEVLKKCQNRNLTFTTNTVEAIKAADIIFICLNNPVSNWGESEKIFDLRDIEKATRLIANVSENNKIIVMKNTVPVGSNKVLKQILSANVHKVKFHVLSVPEFFIEGNAVQSLLYPERILIGSDAMEEDQGAVATLVSIYCQWVPRNKILTMSYWSAELTKLGQQLLVAQRLSSVIALSILCEELGADVSDVVFMIAKCEGIGQKYLQPTFGFGGTNLINDLMCMIYMCERLGLSEAAEYWKQVVVINDYQKKRFRQKILSSFFNTLTHKKIAIWGVAYKKNGEIVNTPAVELCLNLVKEKAKLRVYDPRMERKLLLEELNTEGIAECLKEVIFYDDPYKAARKADAIIVCTNCEEFRSIDYAKVYREMLRPAYIFDGQNFLQHSDLKKIGFIVKTIGKALD